MLEIRWINFNMGCIETIERISGADHSLRLTLTWDVLKLNNMSCTFVPVND